MGTTLTGTTPQDTYDSLIKVTDNGPLSGTAKYLSDGLGNDSALALSTTAVGINTSSPATNLHISGDVNGRAALRLASTAANRLAAVSFFGNNVESAVIGYEGGSEIISGGVQGDFIIRNVLAGKDIILDTNGGNVGIGTLAPQAKLDVTKAGKDTIAVLDSTAFAAGVGGTLDLGGNYRSTGDFSTFTRIAAEKSNATDGNYGFDLGFYVTTNGGSTLGTKVATMTSDAYLRLAASTGGIQFNGDTAAANALDDYEEGTWTPAFTMGTSGTVTMGDVLGRYTKIGNVVTCTGYANAASVSSPVGELRITGLPFTVGSGNDSGITLFAYGFANTTSVTAYQGFTAGSVNYAFVRGFNNGDQVQNIGANVTGGAGLIFTITYRV